MPGIFVDYWFYYLINYLLAALMWTCLGRFLLGFFVAPGSTNYIWRFFCRITDPVLAAVRFITPRFVVEPFMPLIGAFWLVAARILFWVIMYNAGLAPQLAAYGVAE